MSGPAEASDAEARNVREAVTRHTAWLVATVSALDDVAAPSLCEGWTRGHILTHVARNADGMNAMVRSAVDGSGESMYVSQERRDADIEAGADRGLTELVADLRETATELDSALARLDGVSQDVLVDRLPGGPRFRAVDLPFMRLREVIYHHADLTAGFGLEDVEPALVARFLRLEASRMTGPAMTLNPSDSEPVEVAGGGTVVRGESVALLRWLARRETDGVVVDDGGDLPEIPRGS